MQVLDSLTLALLTLAVNMDVTNSPVTRVTDLVGSDINRTPAFVMDNPQAGNLNATPLAGLSIFSNPVEGNIGSAQHEGDLGGAA